jgi:two-component system NtrC family sensor kinase
MHMKLARKFAVTLFLGICTVLAVEALFTSQSEVEMLRLDKERDHKVMGGALAAAATELWRRADEGAAAALVESANSPGSDVRCRWTRPGAAADSPFVPKFPELTSTAIQLQEAVAIPGKDADPVGRLYTIVPVLVDAAGPAAIELSESLEDERNSRQRIFYRIIKTTVAAAAVSGLLAMVIGIWFVGQPTHQLIEHARRVGSGDFTSHLELHQRDELSELAGELNAMSDRLREAHERVAAETSARIAMIEQLRHADRLATVGKLASGVAHELGTPLNVVWARAKMVLSSATAGNEAASNARIIAEQSEHMTKIIRQLLDFARPRSPRKSRVDLWQVVNQTLALLRPMAQKRGVSFVFDGDGEPVPAEIDPDQLQQVLTNLAVNGIQAMPEPGKLTVGISRLRTEPPPDQPGPVAPFIRVVVKDEGVGISPHDRVHLFEPFFTTKGVGEGTGLGLSVSRGIIREHGGWIAVESEPGKGSSFAIYLPDR